MGQKEKKLPPRSSPFQHLPSPHPTILPRLSHLLFVGIEDLCQMKLEGKEIAKKFKIISSVKSRPVVLQRFQMKRTKKESENTLASV